MQGHLPRLIDEAKRKQVRMLIRVCYLVDAWLVGCSGGKGERKGESSKNGDKVNAFVVPSSHTFATAVWVSFELSPCKISSVCVCCTGSDVCWIAVCFPMAPPTRARGRITKRACVFVRDVVRSAAFWCSKACSPVISAKQNDLLAVHRAALRQSTARAVDVFLQRFLLPR